MSTATAPPRAGQRRAAFRGLMAMLSFFRPAIIGMLPYPDLPRRIRMRRRAFRLVTCTPWPGDDATGDDAAQLALLRLLWLQKRVRRAVRMRRGDEAALLARASLETSTDMFSQATDELIAKLLDDMNSPAGEPPSGTDT